MKTKTITFELNGYEIERMRRILSAIKDFNRATEEKADISYEIIQHLDFADRWLAGLIGLEQPECEHGHRNAWADYVWKEEDAD
tara:strand:- start:18 stop:269 length:252 start_codon:yes stop_codon:yes gene_type:complete